MDWRAQQPHALWEWIGLRFLFVLLVVFGGVVEYRSALMSRRMGDLDVFLRAAWAVRANADPYQVTSDNDWHYLYPPLYAILLTPLADPPPGHDNTGYLPYSWSVAICYLLNVLCLCWAAHALASALEARADDASFRSQPVYCRRWWALRHWPVLVCSLPICHTMMRGQVNLIVLAALCAALAGWIRGHNFRAGLWLALAICIKVIPAYLLVYPLWKRDGRGLLGCGAGLLLGLAVIPLAAFGPERTQTHYETYAKVFFGPFFKLNEDSSRQEEILGGVNATESIGVRNAIFNWAHPNPAERPADLPTWGKIVYLLLGVGMTILTLWPTRRAGHPSIMTAAYPFAALIVLMMIFSPVCHSHYLLFCLPIVMCLLAANWEWQSTIHVSRLVTFVCFAFFVTMAVAYLPGLEILKDRCASLLAALPLWVIPVWRMWRTANPPSTEETVVVAVRVQTTGKTEDIVGRDSVLCK